MKKRKAVLFAVACCVIAVGVVAVLLLGRYHSRGYGISVGRLYFADFGTYLIDNNDSAMLVSDKSGQGNLFARCNSGDRVVVFHGGIAESYPAQTVGYAVIRIGKGDQNFTPSDETLSKAYLGTDGEKLVGEDVGFNAQYIRTSWNDEEHYPAVRVIRSVEELQNYYNENKDKYNLERRENPLSDYTIGFLDAVDKYDEAYFKEQILIMVLVEEGSGSNRHKVSYVKKGSDGKIYTDILSIVPEIGTDDMAGWHILIEPEKGVAVEKTSEVVVLLDGIDPSRKPTTVRANKNFANISFTLFDGFEYAVCDENEGPDFWIEVWPSEKSEEKMKISFNSSFAVCGTGLCQEKIKLAGYDAVKGTYAGDKLWQYIAFEGMPGSYVIESEHAYKWWDEFGESAWQMLGTLKLAEGIIFEEDAVAIAKGAATVQYDNVDTSYDSFSGFWTVHFSKSNTAGGDVTVTITHEGKVVETKYGE